MIRKINQKKIGRIAVSKGSCQKNPIALDNPSCPGYNNDNNYNYCQQLTNRSNYRLNCGGGEVLTDLFRHQTDDRR